MDWELTQAKAEHIDELVDLVNAAYRGESSKKGWTTEEHLLGGQRTDPDTLRAQLEEENSYILIAQDEENDDFIEGCVHLRQEGEKCYLGMLTVDPELQGEGLGKFLLQESEIFADMLGCTEMYMTVLEVRNELIAWYEKHGYTKTNETRPFPYGDARFGIPKREDLRFIILRKHINIDSMN